MKIWPWSKFARLEAKLEERGKELSAARSGERHYRRVLESIPTDIAEEGQRKVSAWYREQARQMAPSIWNM